MKKYLLIAVQLFCSTLVFCQTTPVKNNLPDSVIIVYEDSKKLMTADNPPFYYVDGKQWSSSAVGAIDPENIQDVKVKKDANGSGEVHITLIDPSKIPNLVFLSQELEKHLGRLDMPTIYVMDHQFLKDELTSYKIKANNILSIEVMTSDNIASLSQSRLKLRVVKIYTKSKKNLDKAKQIYIRGM